MFRRGKSVSGSIAAVADVHGSGASVAILSLEHGAPSELLSLGQRELPLESRSMEQARTQLPQLLLEAAQEALNTYASSRGAPVEASRAIRHVTAVIHPPWTSAETITAASHLKEDIVVTPDVIGQLAKEEIGKHPEMLANLLEASVVHVELNGYHTGKPKGKSAHDIYVAMLVSSCDAALRASVEETLVKAFSQKPVLRSSVRALLALVSENSALGKESLIVDMSGEATTLVALHKGIEYDSRTVQEGVNSIVRRVAGKKMPEEVLPQIRLVATDQCEADACREIKTALAAAEPDLARSFGEVLGQLAVKRRLPNRIIIIAQDDMTPWLSHFFSRLDFTQFTCTLRPFAPTALLASDLHEHVRYARPLAPDMDLLVAASLVNIDSANE